MTELTTWTLILFLYWPATGERDIAYHDVKAKDRAECIAAQWKGWREHYRRDGAEVRLADCMKRRT